MVDYLTVELPDPVGIPVNDGQIARIGVDGVVEWSTACRKNVEGSYSSNMTFRAIGADYLDDDNPALIGLRDNVKQSGLEVSGNPAKFLQGHNLFGSDDVSAVLSEVITKARTAIWPDLFEDPELDLSEALISRIDLTGSWLLDREADVLPVLRAMEESCTMKYRGRGMLVGGTTLYYGYAGRGEDGLKKRAKDWQLKLYSKGRDITLHPLPLPAYQVPGLLDEVNRTVRVELTLRTAELKRLGLRKVGQWTAAKVREIWEAYVSKLDFREATVNLDTADLGALGLKARHVHALAAWKAGNDLRVGISRPTFYRLRKEIKDATGFDIANMVPKSNVVPLRRVVTVQPALRPIWADHLTEALARAA